VPELSISGKRETAALIKLSSTTTGSSTTGFSRLLEHENKIAKKVAETSKLNFFFHF
jgi:hypothetical protein